MKFGQIFKTVGGYVWRLPLCAFAYIAGTMASARLVSAIGMKLPPIPEQANEQMMGLCLLISSCCGNSICHSRESGNPVFRSGPLLSQG